MERATELLMVLTPDDGELNILPPPPSWQREAVCAGEPAETFYPDDKATAKRQVADARELCGWCPVREQCLAWAIEYDESGVWGGTTEVERRAMRREQAA